MSPDSGSVSTFRLPYKFSMISSKFCLSWCTSNTSPLLSSK